MSRGLGLPPRNAPLPTSGRDDSLGLRLVGKWGRGPAAEVTGRDTLVAFTLGSEVALLNCANPYSPVVLSEIQLDLIPRQSAFFGSYLVTSDDGIEFWDISDPRAPVFRSSIPYTVGDFAIVDTFVFFVRGDTFHAYSVGDPTRPYELGRCLEGGYVTAATRNVAVVRAPGDVMDFVDVSNPGAPRYAGTYPGWVWSAAARGNLCYATFADPDQPEMSWFAAIDISNPASPVELARCDSVIGDDIYLEDSLAFVSGREEAYSEEFRIVSIADSTNPRLRGTCSIWDINYGVWARQIRHAAYVASVPTGLAIVDVTDLDQPRLDTFVLTADYAWSVWPERDRVYVADYGAGVRILSISDPTRPGELGGLDSSHVAVVAAVARDSFAFISWEQPPFLRTLDVSDPARPTKVGGCDLFNWPEAMVLRDTLLYIAEYARFQVVNVARPRQPTLVGSCNIAGTGMAVFLRDTLAFVSTSPTQIINVADASTPRAVGTLPYSTGVAVRDSFAFLPALFDSLLVYNVADVSAPFQVAVLRFPEGHQYTSGATLADSLLYVGGDYIHVIDVSDPLAPRQTRSWQPPDYASSLAWDSVHLYAACYGAGVCILDTAGVGLAEQNPLPSPRVAWPTSSVIRDRMVLNLQGMNGKEVIITAFDVAGNVVYSCALRGQTRTTELSLAQLPTGVYVLRACSDGRATSFKFVKL